MATKEEIYSELVGILDDLFEIEPSKVTMQSQLYDDLDIDSIDAVDMMVKLQEITGERLDPEAFKNVRSVSDCVDAVESLYLRLESR